VIADRFGWQIFPVRRRLVLETPAEPPPGHHNVRHDTDGTG
jgi:hypothetical protein